MSKLRLALFLALVGTSWGCKSGDSESTPPPKSATPDKTADTGETDKTPPAASDTKAPPSLAGKAIGEVLGSIDRIEYKPAKGEALTLGGDAATEALTLLDKGKLTDAMARCMSMGTLDFHRGDKQVGSVILCGNLTSGGTGVLTLPDEKGAPVRRAGLSFPEGDAILALFQGK